MESSHNFFTYNVQHCLLLSFSIVFIGTLLTLSFIYSSISSSSTIIMRVQTNITHILVSFQFLLLVSNFSIRISIICRHIYSLQNFPWIKPSLQVLNFTIVFMLATISIVFFQTCFQYGTSYITTTDIFLITIQIIQSLIFVSLIIIFICAANCIDIPAMHLQNEDEQQQQQPITPHTLQLASPETRRYSISQCMICMNSIKQNRNQEEDTIQCNNENENNNEYNNENNNENYNNNENENKNNNNHENNKNVININKEENTQNTIPTINKNNDNINFENTEKQNVNNKDVENNKKIYVDCENITDNNNIQIIDIKIENVDDVEEKMHIINDTKRKMPCENLYIIQDRINDIKDNIVSKNKSTTNANRTILYLVCGHGFHSHCIETWINGPPKQNIDCPLCKQKCIVQPNL